MTVDEIKKHADAVSVPRSSIVKSSNYFATSFTSVVDNMHAANVSVYAFPFRNEFVNMEFDYFADPMVELATYTALLRVDGVITEFPATANAYLRSPCSNLEANISYSILPVQPGSLLSLVPAEVMPPAEAPAPVLSVADVVHPPPPAATNTSASTPTTAPAGKKSRSRGPSNAANTTFGLVAIMLASLVSVCF